MMQQIRRKFVIKSTKKSIPPAITLGEQMEEMLTEWYGKLGKSVPLEELQICREADATEEVEYQKLIALNKPKLVYGTPEFWKDYWIRKGKKTADASKKDTSEKQKS